MPTSASTVPLKTCRVERLMHVKPAEVQCPPVGGMPASSLDQGSKSRDPSRCYQMLYHLHYGSVVHTCSTRMDQVLVNDDL
ncbi:hypothetical protein TNCV_4573271 [Trichonephila clavipes]|nr:hypothetical protein TNCV_4573271 [Trichonephila clavipes]